MISTAILILYKEKTSEYEDTEKEMKYQKMKQRENEQNK